MRARDIVATTVVCASIYAGPVATQSRDVEMIPRTLFIGLNGPYGGRGPGLFVGELPQDFPRELIPEHGQVVGGVVTPGYVTTAIFSVPDPVGAASAVERRARGEGWKVRPYQAYGFLPAEADTLQDNGPVCRDGRSLNVMPIERPETLLRVDILQQNPGCREPQGTATPSTFSTILPVLRLPKGAGGQGGGSFGGQDEEGVFTSFSSILPADQLAADFAEQASKVGWRPTPIIQTSGLGVWTFERPDPNGGRFAALLTVFRLRDSEYSARFEAASSRSTVGIPVSQPAGVPQP